MIFASKFPATKKKLHIYQRYSFIMRDCHINCVKAKKSKFCNDTKNYEGSMDFNELDAQVLEV